MAEQVGLRITEERNEYLRRRAIEMGVSKNDLINILIELGLKIMDSQVTVNVSPRE